MSNAPMMTAEALRQSVERDDAPPSGIGDPLVALWHAGKGELERAYDVIAGNTSREAAWVRAHLHRRKGEEEEAADWYRKAGKDPSGDGIDDEWLHIAAGVTPGLLLRP